MHLLIKLNQLGYLGTSIQFEMSKASGATYLLFLLMCFCLLRNIAVEVPVLSRLYRHDIDHITFKRAHTLLWRFLKSWTVKKKMYGKWYVIILMQIQCFYFTSDWNRIIIWKFKNRTLLDVTLSFTRQATYSLSELHWSNQRK